MRKVLKWIGIIVGGLLGLIVVALVVLSFVGGTQLKKTREVEVETITIPDDEVALARGEHLVNIACRDCHGADLAGGVIFDEAPLGAIYAANISGVAQTHSDADLIRAIRHGVDQDGRQLMIMPAETFVHFSAEDLGAVIAYLKTVPRTGDDKPSPSLSIVGRAMLGAGVFGDMFPAEILDHDQPFAAMPEIGANEAYGAYVVNFCRSCHGADLAGGQPPEPGAPLAPNLTPGGELGGWSESDFMQVFATGTTPTGRQLSASMPWESFGKFSEDELRGVWMYLQSLPPQTTASQ
jgi:mono/diheme cytochrome c family protein